MMSIARLQKAPLVPKSNLVIIHTTPSRLTALTILEVFNYLGISDKISFLRTEKFIAFTLQSTSSFSTYIHHVNNFKKDVWLPYLAKMNESYQTCADIRSTIYAKINDLPPFIETQITDRSNTEVIAKKLSEIHNSCGLRVRSIGCGVPPNEGFSTLMSLFTCAAVGAAIGGCTVCCGCINPVVCASACGATAEQGCCSAIGFGAAGGVGGFSTVLACTCVVAGSGMEFEKNQNQLKEIIALCSEYKKDIASHQVLKDKFFTRRALFFSAKPEEKSNEIVKSTSNEDFKISYVSA